MDTSYRDLSKDTPLKRADGALRDALIELAQRFFHDPRRPCCDADTTLADWEGAIAPGELYGEA